MMEPQCILVIDDNDGISTLIARVLQMRGYTVRTAHNGIDGLAAFEYSRPDAVILDLNLPGLSGEEICREIKAQGSTPVIIISGQAPTRSMIEEQVACADAYVPKPFDIMALADRLGALLSADAASRHEGVQVWQQSLG